MMPVKSPKRSEMNRSIVSNISDTGGDSDPQPELYSFRLLDVWYSTVYVCKFSRFYSSMPHLQRIRALASARGSVATRRVATGPRAWRARGQRARPLEGPRVAKTCESEGPKGPRTSKAKCPSRSLPVLLYVFHNSAQNREIHGPFSRP